ncbi:probable xyloglucan endotransglucosylase/hydrolase protein 30 [Cornus florida]|uniref:probable xyloglucan endotransglucosylase/hydrolase protein 30 n=1 Tax=Cornus florida TaxID=4283 RepID=UPI0028A0D937|nr:probable xyloglucan endotransglucosylase/hydrolase protein 30 [Cornus florida]
MEVDHIHHRSVRQYYSLSRTLLLMPFSLLFFSLLLCVDINIAEGFNLTTTTFGEGYSPLFSDFNIHRSPDDKKVSLLLNRHSGSGFISTDYYNYGLFSANIKLPSNYSAGIVVAFYTSNTDFFGPKGHDELDIEFLGNRQGMPWRFQTNFYGNGSTSRGREERYYLWFDPSKEFHRYSILWTSKNIIFYVDDVPIREVVHSEEMGSDYPAKPMSLYATIWDASSWATDGGKYRVNYEYEPFVSEFKDLVLQGCKINPIMQTVSAAGCRENASKLEAANYANITPRQRSAMKRFREKYMYYSYCYDSVRYPVPLPECVIVPTEKKLFKVTGRLKKALRIKFGKKPRTHLQRRSGGSSRRSPVIPGGGGGGGSGSSSQLRRVVVSGDGGGGGGRLKADI